MPAQVIKAPSKEPAKFVRKVFLAGTCKTNWREQLVQMLSDLDVTFLDPERSDWPTEKEQLDLQIAWEWANIRRAGVVAVYLEADRQGAISLFELGGALYRHHKAVLVGMEPGYQHADNVETQLRLAGSSGTEYTITNSLAGLAKEIRRAFA